MAKHIDPCHNEPNRLNKFGQDKEVFMDWQSEEGKRLAERLKEEQVIWLTTVRQDGTPIPTPVWFLWEGEAFLIYTKPGSFKLKNSAANPRAALNLNSDEYGGAVVVFTGTLTVETDEPPALQNPAYLTKYREAVKDMQTTPEALSKEYSVALRFHPTHIRAE